MREQIIAYMMEMYHRNISVFYLLVARIEIMTRSTDSMLAGLSKGQYKRIIREGRKLQSALSDEEDKTHVEEVIIYIRNHMEEWRAS